MPGLKRSLPASQLFPAAARDAVVVIFTSHSIPVRYITAGDPYQKQIEETVGLVAAKAGVREWRIAWQSKGARATEPWIEPEVEPTLDKLAQEGRKAVLEVPIGFTCDHMETLYDIDIVHRKHAAGLGISFERAGSLNTSPLFIKALADVVKKAYNLLDADEHGRGGFESGTSDMSDVTEKVIKAFYTVYNTLGYGFLEKVYVHAL